MTSPASRLEPFAGWLSRQVYAAHERYKSAPLADTSRHWDAFVLIMGVQEEYQRRQPKDLAYGLQRIARLEAALTEIRDRSDDCGCTHGDAYCCVKVGEFCAFCIASAALAEEG